METGGEQLRIDLLLHITHQEEPPVSDLPCQHDAHIVDPGATVGRLLRNAAAFGPQHTERDLVDDKAIARGDAEVNGSVGVIHVTEPGRVAGSGTTHPRLHHAVHVVSLKEQREAGHVILVWMRQDHRVDATVPRRYPTVEGQQESIRVRPAIDQQPSSTGSFDKDCVTLANVQDRHARKTSGASREHPAGNDDGDEQGHGRGSLRARSGRVAGRARRSYGADV